VGFSPIDCDQCEIIEEIYRESIGAGERDSLHSTLKGERSILKGECLTSKGECSILKGEDSTLKKEDSTLKEEPPSFNQQSSCLNPGNGVSRGYAVLAGTGVGDSP